MSGNGGSNGATELDAIEARIRAEFPLSDPNSIYRLLVRWAAKNELYHRAVESNVDTVAEVRETVRHLPCQEDEQPRCPEGT